MRLCLMGLLFLLGFALLGALRVERVSFAANFEIAEDELLRAGSLQTGVDYDPAAVNASIAALQLYLRQNGHPFVRVPLPELIPLDSESLELAFRLVEVLPAGEAALSFTGLRYFSLSRLRELLLLGPGDKVALSKLPALLDAILDLYHQRGYLFAAVQLDSLSLRDSLVAQIGISEGKPLRLERFYFQGNKYTRDKTLSKLTGLSLNSLVTPRQLQIAEESILRKSYISSCQVEPIDPASVLIKVTEGRMTYLEGVLGFTRRNAKTELSGQLRLRFLNLWGSDRSLGLNWRQNPASGLLELNYHESGPSALALVGDFALARATQDSTWIRSSLTAAVYSYRGNHKYGLELAAESIAPGLRRPILVERDSQLGLGAFWSLDSRDNALNPGSGVQTTVAYHFLHAQASGTWNNALELDHAQFLGLGSRWTAALGLHLRSLAKRDTLDYALYRMGGFNSLRGYRQEEFSSWRLGWANLELRYLITPLSRVYLFYDHGLLKRPDDSLRLDILAPGIGLRVRTRLGILSLEYALGLREDGLASLGSGMVHAGLDTSF